MSEEQVNKLITYSVALVVILIFLVVLYFIWSPTFSKLDSDGINKYEDVIYDEEIKKYYTEYLNKNLKVTNFDTLYLNISQDYINEIGISDKNELKEFLKENDYISMNFTINNIDIYSNDLGTVIMVTYVVNGNTRYVCINENKPYNFTVSFMKNEELSKSMLTFNRNEIIDNVDYTIDIIESTRDNIKLKINITNDSNNNFYYDFSYLDSIQIVYSDNKITNIAAIANSNNSSFELTPGSTNSVEVTFNLSWKDQLNISKIKINNIKLNGSDYKVEI